LSASGALEPPGTTDLQFSLEFRRTEKGPVFTVVDSKHRPVAASELVSKSLARSQVIGTPLAHAAFEYVDAIWLQDERIAELVRSGITPT